MNKGTPKILLTLDLEEFDIPLEYDQTIDIEAQLTVTNEGLNKLEKLIHYHQINCTFFTTAFFAGHFSQAIRLLSQQHEIASHAFYHSIFRNEDLLLSKEKLEAIIEKKVIGFRMPRMRDVDDEQLAAAGYLYDSSINPTWLPGRYNRLGSPRTLYKSKHITHIPASVSPNFRIPLFWLFFKNAPMMIIKKISAQTLRKDGYLNLYFHPWEFADIPNYHLPGWMKKPCGDALIKKLNEYIIFLKTLGEFSTVAAHLFPKHQPDFY